MSSDDALERELKFGPVDLGDLRERLRDLDADCLGSPVLEDNWLFDADGRLGEAGSLLRLRVDRRGAVLTFKGPATYEDRVKVRTEHETGVESSERARSILEALGFSKVRRYQKYREVWRLGSIEISLDHTPMGDFVEIEGEGCERVAKRCGLDPEKSERRNYMRLYEDHRKEHPEAPPDMVFP